MTEFNLGDFVESLPYKGGPGSPDEYISNALIAKRLELRNKEIQDNVISGSGKSKYIPSSDKSYYISVGTREKYQYSPAVSELEDKLKALQAKINNKKRLEEASGVAKRLDPTDVLTVRPMSPNVLDRIELEEKIASYDDDL